MGHTPPASAVGFATVPGGGRIAHSNAGDGFPLVMVPGWLSHVTELWSHPSAASSLAKLTERHRFVWYDRLGCGQSDRDRVSLSIDDDVAQLVAVLEALGIDRCDLIGYSFGGPVAATFAARHPERVRHLVLYSTYARGAALADAEPYAALVNLVRSGWKLASRTLAALFLPDGSAEDLRWFSRFQQRSATPEIAAELLVYLRNQDVTDILPTLRVPTTVVTATDDRAVTPDNAREIAGLVPGARLVMVDGRTHDPFIRDGGDVVEAILAAVEERPQVPTPADESARRTRSLTERETDVLQALARGASNKEIAAALGISVATVERHLTNLYRKLGASGRAAAAVHAVTSGLVTAEQGWR